VVVGDQGSLDGGADLPVVPDAGVEGEEPLDDAGPEPCGDAAAVAFEAELAFRVQMTASTRWRGQFGNGRGCFSSLRAGRSRVCRAWSRSPCSLGFARLNPVTVPSQVQISSSLQPSTSGNGSRSTRTRRTRTGQNAWR
jgi:hypothetical protein